MTWKDRTNENVAKVPINYDLSMVDSVKIIADWLKNYKKKYEINYVVMYHAASKKAPVLEQGLLAGNSKRKNYGISESGHVYLAANPVMAKQFGDMTYNGDYSIYEVIVPVGKLLPDKNRLKFTTPDGATGIGLAQSLIYAGSARVKGDIERWQIKPFDGELCDNTKPSLLAQLSDKIEEVKAAPVKNKEAKKDCTER